VKAKNLGKALAQEFESPLEIKFNISCYHWETRKRRRSGKQGGTYTERVKVVTHTASELF